MIAEIPDNETQVSVSIPVKGEDRYRNIFGSGKYILQEGPGKGFASYPWALDDYERALGLRPKEAWLMKFLFRFSWDDKGIVFPSIRKIEKRSLVSRATVTKILKSLQNKGYISRIGQIDSILDRRVRYDISGIKNALMTAIICDSESKFAKENGAQSLQNIFKLLKVFDQAPEEFHNFTTPDEVNKYYIKKGLRFDWGEFHEDVLITRSEKVYEITCHSCGTRFLVRSLNTKYCDKCRVERANEQWLTFQKDYLAHVAKITDG